MRRIAKILIIARLWILVNCGARSIYHEDLKCSQIEGCLADEDEDSGGVSGRGSTVGVVTSGGPISTMKEMDSCFCDAKCLIYGDCCLSVRYKTIPPETRIGSLTCQRISFRKKTVFIQLVSKCPKQNKYSSSLVKKCENKVSVFKDPFLSIPIYSQKTQFNYKNIYCAVCNNDVDFALPWTAYPLCTGHGTLENSPNDGSGLFGDGCYTFFEPPLNGSYRFCQQSSINSCPDDWFEPHVRKKCDLYSAPLKDESTESIIKNEYCAICNNMSQESMKCLRNKPMTWTNEDAFDVSFSVIIDIDFTNGGTMVGRKERCPKNHIYDPWKKVCRLISCQPGTTFVDHKCVPTNENVTADCPRIGYTVDEYLLTEENAVVLFPMNQSYKVGEYWIDDGSKKLWVCAPPSYSEFTFRFGKVQHLLSTVGLSVSILSLFAKIIAFFVKPEPRKTSTILVLFLSVSLLVAQALFLLGINQHNYGILCQLIGLLMHYFFLSSFFWMNALAYDIYLVFGTLLQQRKKKSVVKQMSIYSIYGWILPGLIVLVAVTFQVTQHPLSPRYGDSLCWISNKVALLTFFAIPLAILLMLNIVLFTITSARIHRISKESKVARENLKEKEKFRFTLYIKLALLMGITWIIGFVAAYVHKCVLWSAFVVFNSLQGFYVFMAFTHLKYGPFFKAIRKFSVRSSTNTSTMTISSSTKL